MFNKNNHIIAAITIAAALLLSQPAHAGTFDSTRAGARFYYDAFGRQVAKVARYRDVPIEEDKYVDYNLSEHYLYDGTGMLMKLEAAQKNYADIKTRSFYYGNDNVSDTPQIAYVDGEPLYNLLDPDNSILASFSREGDKILYHDVGNYTEYGQPDEEASQGDPLGNQESFCGMDFDRVMGMYYDHSTNRWRDVRTKQEIQAGYNPTWTKPSPGALQIGGSVAAGVFLDSWYDVPTCLVGYDPLLGKLTGFERVAGLLPFVGSSAVRAGWGGLKGLGKRLNPRWYKYKRLTTQRGLIHRAADAAKSGCKTGSRMEFFDMGDSLGLRVNFTDFGLEEIIGSEDVITYEAKVLRHRAFRGREGRRAPKLILNFYGHGVSKRGASVVQNISGEYTSLLNAICQKNMSFDEADMIYRQVISDYFYFRKKGLNFWDIGTKNIWINKKWKTEGVSLMYPDANAFEIMRKRSIFSRKFHPPIKAFEETQGTLTSFGKGLMEQVEMATLESRSTLRYINPFEAIDDVDIFDLGNL